MKIWLALIGVFFYASATADWLLDNEASSVSFVSVKNGAVVEAHEFLKLSGAVSLNGTASVTIDLSSVETLIPIRNDRMKAMLFKTEEFPHAVVSLQLDKADLDQLGSGSAVELSTEASLVLMGTTHSVAVQAIAIPGDNSVIVSSLKPSIVNAKSLGLLDGVHALRDIAGLNDITLSVPVSFVLKFDVAKN